jgi:preprotein translocase subunit SecY
MNKEGEFGRKKINQITRIMTLPLAVIQGIGTIFLVRQQASQVSGLGDITANASLTQWVLMVASLTGGAMLLMWLGELITEQNIGNGISLLITVGIISSLPSAIINLISTVFGSGENWVINGVSLPINRTGLLFSLVLFAVVFLVTAAVVRLNEAQRRLTVHYAKRVQGNRTYGGVTTVLPVKLITAGVIPIIFAVAFLSVPSFAGQLLANNSSEKLQNFGQTLNLWFQPPTSQTLTSGDWHAFVYPIVYFLLVFLFTFFYTSIAFNAPDIAENLQKQGGFISGVRSGKQTEKYLSKVVNRLTLFGAIALGLLAVVPIVAEALISSKYNVPNMAITGTSILILVAVSLETLRQVESRAMLITYSQYDGSDFFQVVEKQEKKRFYKKLLKNPTKNKK